jgi:hypothetical protein
MWAQACLTIDKLRLSHLLLQSGQDSRFLGRFSYVRARHFEGRSRALYDLEGVLGPTITRFVARHVRSLLAWDVIVFFHRNSTAVLDISGLASRLGRRVEEVEPEVGELCEGSILNCTGGLIRYDPTPELRDEVQQFVESCQDRGKRLALIAQVLNSIGRNTEK